MRKALLVCCLLVPVGIARGYEERVHALLSQRGYRGPVAVAQADDAAAVRALRERIWRAGAEARDAALQRRFLSRYPSLAGFDAWDMKELFALNPERRVAGFDETVSLPGGQDGVTLYAAASRLPDDDWRNRDRYRHDRQRKQEHDAWGRPLPDDPATLEMGALTGLSSQAHAHYGLPKLAFSDDPAVLRSDPRRFAVPPTVHTFGADFVASYTGLAILAARLPGGQRLALTQAAAAAHHLEDVANQIHTVQVGIYPFFVDAKLQSYKEELLSVGGLLFDRPNFLQIGLTIISNHHILAEGLYAKHLLTPGDPVAVQTWATPADPAFQHTLDSLPAGCLPDFGHAIAAALIDRSSYEGPEVYGAIRAVALRRWSRAGQHFDETDDPDRALRKGADLRRFWALEAMGARRGLQALDAWWSHFSTCPTLSPEGEQRLAERLVRQRLDALEAAEARARSFTPSPPAREAKNWGVLTGYLVVLVAVGWLLRHRRRRSR